MRKTKQLLLTAAILFSLLTKVHAGDTTAHIYHPEASAAADIARAVAEAKATHKNVLIQAGGNWCSWCMRFNALTTQDAQLDSAIKAGYVVYHLNYSKENKNLPVFAQYGYAQRFGFPVFIILDENGNRLHTQNSAYLEEGKGYSKTKVLDFLQSWSPDALNPSHYKQ
ncbi:thioredoxin family protein [Deminuibacter soli]|uniref:Thioredoxin family protein n=1 Tax=Deminuibacter soli TaxID=2291815 RepID=A0A3E1NCZ3_9BACT|nr:thioredoxin family protein [Deminuibacter soli]RFM25697.1 thioredoxin family protein [Deminuibacter soli]